MGSSVRIQQHPEDVESIDFIGGVGRWLLVAPVVLVVLLTCGEAGTASARIPDSADTKSRIKVDYSPWPFAVVRPVNPEIVEVIRADMAFYGESELPGDVPSEGEFWVPTLATVVPTAAAGLTPHGTSTLGPAASETPPSSGTSSAIPAYGSKTPEPSASQTPAPPGTRTPTPGRTQTPNVPTQTASPTRPAQTSTPTRTSSPTRTPTTAPIASSTVPPSGGVVVLNVTSSSDDVNEDQGSFEDSYTSLWLGNGSSRSDSWTGLRYTGVDIPRGATIKSAVLQIAAIEETLTPARFTMQAEAAGNCGTYGAGSPPSRRSLTTESVLHDDTRPWPPNAYFGVGDMAGSIQAVISRNDWQVGNSLCLILHGEGTREERKLVHSFEGNPSMAPRLLIDYVFTP